VLTTNPATVWLSFPALAITLAYPYAKRVLAVPQAVLGVAFSFGIPMAFAAALGSSDWSLAAIAAAVPPQAWLLLVGNLFWVLAYDTEYAMVDRDDDLRIGMKTSAITLGRLDVAGVMLFYAAYLLSWAWLGLSLGLGRIFLLGIAPAPAGGLALPADPGAQPRRLLQGLPAEPLAGPGGVRRRGAGSGFALKRSLQVHTSGFGASFYDSGLLRSPP
jgi:4-hydroxybenzoate polyprenyltransferase